MALSGAASTATLVVGIFWGGGILLGIGGGGAAPLWEASLKGGEAASAGSRLGVRALFFDMFGTILDWRTGVARSVQHVLTPAGYSLDWLAFADAWRGQYQPAMEEVRSGRKPYEKIDVLHRRTLEKILPGFGISNLSEEMLHHLTLSWHRLDAWADVPTAFPRLGAHFLMAPVSNGNIALVSDVARRNGLRFDAVLGADIARNFKPCPSVYQSAVDAFNLKPADCMMVFAAAHEPDAVAAAKAGLRTAAISRPDEYGLGTSPEAPSVPVDILARDLNDLADQLGA